MIQPRTPPPLRLRVRWGDIAITLAVIGATFFIIRNILLNMDASGVQPGFAFLWSEAGFDVSESLIPYKPDDSYARVVITGLLNTLFLSGVSLVLASLVGLAVGLLAVSPTPIGRAVALGYVELFRNLPKILILLVLFIVAVNGLPTVRNALSFGPFHISNRSFHMPMLEWNNTAAHVFIAMMLGAVFAVLALKWAQRRRALTGRSPVMWPLIILSLCGGPLLAAAFSSEPLLLSTPKLEGFDFEGGARVSVQFVVVAVTLALYHGAQIGEVVRGAILAAPKGQWEAAAALGLDRPKTLRFIIAPQVVRMIIPPLNNQYVNLIKNTSVAVAVGYSDLMSVAGTTINQTFRPLEMMLLTMGLYLAICLTLTALINRWSEAMRRREQR